MKTTISVVLPTYNSAEFIGSSLAAILAQTHPVDEIIIADDGSTDGTIGIVEAIADPRIRVIRLPHGGTAMARTAGIRAATGEWVAWCDADDVWRPDKIERQLAEIGDYDVIYSNANLIRDGNIVGNFWAANRIRPRRGGPEMLKSVFWRNPVVSASAMARRSLLIKALDVGIDPAISMDIDYAIWLKMLTGGARFTYVPERLLDYRLHKGQQTSKRLLATLWTEFVLQEFLADNPWFIEEHPFFVRLRMGKLYLRLVHLYVTTSRGLFPKPAYPLRRALETLLHGAAVWDTAAPVVKNGMAPPRAEKAPSISVVVPVYNGEAHIADTLRSILAQTVPVFEILVMDDGSTDRTAEIVAGTADPRVKHLRLPHRGAGVAREKGIREAKGDLIGFCDADDLWLPYRLERQLAALGDYDLVHSNGYILQGSRRVIDCWTYWHIHPNRGGREILPNLFERNEVITSSVLVRRDKAVKALDADLDPRYCLDIDYPVWFRLLEQGAKFNFVREPLIEYRIHMTQQSRKIYLNKVFQAHALFTFLRRNPLFLREHPVLVRTKFFKTHLRMCLERLRNPGPGRPREVAFHMARITETMLRGRPSSILPAVPS